MGCGGVGRQVVMAERRIQRRMGVTHCVGLRDPLPACPLATATAGARGGTAGILMPGIEKPL